MASWTLRRYLETAHETRKIGPLHLHALAVLLEKPMNAASLYDAVQKRVEGTPWANDLAAHGAVVPPEILKNKVDQRIRTGLAPNEDSSRKHIAMTALLFPFFHPAFADKKSIFDREAVQRFFPKPADGGLPQGLINEDEEGRLSVHPAAIGTLNAFLKQKQKG